MHRNLILALILVSAAGLGGWWMMQGRAQSGDRSRSVDLVEGEQLYQRYCAACHGAALEGQPDWRSPGPDGVLPAPPHDASGHTWHHADGLLFEYTKFGGKAALARLGVEFESGMPGFGDQLSDDQIRSILAYIKSTWPERIRELQAGRTAAERPEQSEN